MPNLKLTVATVAAVLAWLPAAPAAVAGPWLVPWALGHVIGAAARVATLPIIAASAASSAGPPPTPYWTGYAAPPVHYPPAGYYGAPAYYVPPTAYHSAPVGYYGGPQRGYPAYAYRSWAPYVRAVPQPFARYSVPGMRYSEPYGGAVVARSRDFAYRRW
jgi:hypothetical protein